MSPQEIQDMAALILPEPTRQEIKAARIKAGLTLGEAAALVGSPNARAWLRYESDGDEYRQMGIDRWVLFLLALGQHPMYAVRRKRATNSLSGSIDWNKYDSLLGTMSDGQLSEIIGCSSESVASRRKLLGIQSARGRTIDTFDWTRYDELLGTMPDRSLAEIIGCDYKTVFRRRASKGIAPSSTRGRPKKNKAG